MPAPDPAAIVTGGSSGIGRAIALALAEAGYRVAVVGTSAARVAATVDLLGGAAGTQRHLGLVLDVCSEPDMEAMGRRTLERFGRIDLLVASAGIGRLAGSSRVMPHATADLPLAEWQGVIGVNLTGVFLSNRAVIPAMRAQGGGHILNVGSSTTPRGLRGTPYAPAYCASKFGLIGLTETLAEEESRHGIRVQVVLPGPVDTPLVDQTQLARPFGGPMSAESFSAAILSLVRMPLDTVVIHPHVLPFRGGLADAAGQPRPPAGDP